MNIWEMAYEDFLALDREAAAYIKAHKDSQAQRKSKGRSR